MKITLLKPTSKKTTATVWHNDEEHILVAGAPLKLNVKRGDTVKYRVGRFAAVHTLQYQSPDAAFDIEPDQKLQAIAFGVVALALIILYFMGLLDNALITTPVVIVWLIGYEVALYYFSYKAQVQH
ncbi:hypothetical protein [Lacticaseibacillus sharpeae]|uniref:Uncharacterized protein n=1 Tax=Lacticaseibacillus sharpeae JCM 1186 = DSM 20505 TaxID=1291052 RepID=A0A0R1ZV29_9LACO|nr:hypothetical protein [Lacticaseibacillus sharpeae]KRM54851.1 hypothetical protein FC18_GL002268 [Lacticaseibacillus sharpeae JCM 1186 = DSM 20505]